MTNKHCPNRICSGALVRSRSLLMLFAGSFASWIGAVNGAGASCIEPPLEVHWTYPADGDQDVPTNAAIWVVATLATHTVTLDGQPLKAQLISFGAARYMPDRLLPQTEHTLRIGGSADGGAPMIEIAFRTGAGSRMNPVAPSLASFSTTSGFPSNHRCSEIIESQDCFDTAQDTLATLAVSGDAIAWLVQGASLGESAVWPTDCGAPSVFGHSFGSGCFIVNAIGVGGLLSPAVQACAAPVAPLAGSGGRSDAGLVAAPLAGPRASGGAGAASAAGMGSPAVPTSAAGAAVATVMSQAAAEPAPGQCVAAGALGSRHSSQLSAAWVLLVLAGRGWVRRRRRDAAVSSAAGERTLELMRR